MKLWFVIRTFGAEGLRQKVRDHIRWAGELAEEMKAARDFELMAPVPFATVCFRFRPEGVTDTETLDRLNMQLMETLNGTGKIYLTHTKLNGSVTLRLVIGQTSMEKSHVDRAWKLIKNTTSEIPDCPKG